MSLSKSKAAEDCRRHWSADAHIRDKKLVTRMWASALQCFATCALLVAASAQAHQPGLSSLAVQVRDATVAVHLTLARADTERLYPLDADRNGTVTTNEFEAARLTLEELAFQMVAATGDGKTLSPE